MVLEAGVRPLLHTYLADAFASDAALEGLIVENKSGRSAILAKVTVDATGDGDVICRGGAEYEKADGELQPMSLTFIMGQVEYWPEVKTPEMKQAIQKALDENAFCVHRRPALFPMWRKGEVYANATRLVGDCTDAWSLTQAEIEGRRQIMNLLHWFRQNAPGYRNAQILSSAPQIGLRESRRLLGLYTLKREDVLGYRDFDDNIARGAYQIDIHYSGRGGEMTYLEPGKSYGIPYRCLVPKRLDGLLASGRCISASHDAIGSVRVMAICMATGQAAGVAAALASKTGSPLRDLDIAQIQQTLRKQEAIL